MKSSCCGAAAWQLRTAEPSAQREISPLQRAEPSYAHATRLGVGWLANYKLPSQTFDCMVTHLSSRGVYLAKLLIILSAQQAPRLLNNPLCDMLHIISPPRWGELTHTCSSSRRGNFHITNAAKVQRTLLKTKISAHFFVLGDFCKMQAVRWGLKVRDLIMGLVEAELEIDCPRRK